LPSGDQVGFESVAALPGQARQPVPFALTAKISLFPPFSREWKTIRLAEATPAAGLAGR
jgi:hypothetical protein